MTVDIDADDGFFVLDAQGAGSIPGEPAGGTPGVALLSAEIENGSDDDDFIDASASTTPQRAATSVRILQRDHTMRRTGRVTPGCDGAKPL